MAVGSSVSLAFDTVFTSSTDDLHQIPVDPALSWLIVRDTRGFNTARVLPVSQSGRTRAGSTAELLQLVRSNRSLTKAGPASDDSVPPGIRLGGRLPDVREDVIPSDGVVTLAP